MIWIYARIQGFFCLHSRLVCLNENARESAIKSLAKTEFGSCWPVPTSVVDCAQLQEHKNQLDATGLSKQMLAALNAIKHFHALLGEKYGLQKKKNRALRHCRENELGLFVSSHGLLGVPLCFHHLCFPRQPLL